MYSLETKFVNSIQKSIPDLYTLIIIDRGGNLLSYFVSDKCAADCKLDDLKDIAKMVSTRSNLSEFQTRFGSIKAAINVFDDFFMVGKKLDENRIIVITIPKTSKNLLDSFNKILDINHASFIEQTESGLKKIPPGKSEFQVCQEKLLPKMHTFVATPLQSQIKHENRRMYGYHSHD